MGRVFASGTKQTAIQWWWYQAARGETGGHRLGQVVLRAFGTVAIVWFAGGVMWALGVLQYVLPAIWFVAVGVFGFDPYDEEVVDGGEAADRPSHDDVARALHALTGDRNGVHLSAVAARLDIEQPVVRELLDEMEVPYKSVKIRIPGEKKPGVAVGVHKDDLPPLPSPLAESESGQVAGSAAGQSATATATPLVVKQTEKGPEVWVDNPLNPGETHIFRPASSASGYDFRTAPREAS